MMQSSIQWRIKANEKFDQLQTDERLRKTSRILYLPLSIWIRLNGKLFSKLAGINFIIFLFDKKNQIENAAFKLESNNKTRGQINFQTSTVFIEMLLRCNNILSGLQLRFRVE
jgi:hypothetical protein